MVDTVQPITPEELTERIVDAVAILTTDIPDTKSLTLEKREELAAILDNLETWSVTRE